MIKMRILSTWDCIIRAYIHLYNVFTGLYIYIYVHIIFMVYPLILFDLEIVYIHGP